MTVINDLLKMIEPNVLRKKQNADINQLVISALSRKKQTAFAISKKCKVSRTTATTYLYRLKTDIPELNIQNEHIKTGKREVILWWKEAFIGDVGGKA